MKTFDSACYDLASALLEGRDRDHINTTENVEALAELLFTTAEAHIARLLDNYDGPPEGDAWSGGFAPNH